MPEEEVEITSHPSPVEPGLEVIRARVLKKAAWWRFRHRVKKVFLFILAVLVSTLFVLAGGIIFAADHACKTRGLNTMFDLDGIIIGYQCPSAPKKKAATPLSLEY